MLYIAVDEGMGNFINSLLNAYKLFIQKLKWQENKHQMYFKISIWKVSGYFEVEVTKSGKKEMVHSKKNGDGIFNEKTCQ